MSFATGWNNDERLFFTKNVFYRLMAYHKLWKRNGRSRLMVAALFRNSEGVVVSATILENGAGGCRHMPTIARGSADTAYAKAAKKKHIPCGFARIGVADNFENSVALLFHQLALGGGVRRALELGGVLVTVYDTGQVGAIAKNCGLDNTPCLLQVTQAKSAVKANHG